MAELLNTLSVYTVFIPLLTGLLLWKYQEANARIMVCLLVFASIAQIYGTYIEELPTLVNNVYNRYTILDTFAWLLIMYRSTRASFVRYIIFALFLTDATLFSWFYCYHNIEEKFHSNLVCLDSVTQVVCVLLYFYEKYYTEQILDLEKDPMFWFCLAILLYAPCTYFRFALFGIPEFKNLIEFHSIINILLYLLIAVGFSVKLEIIKSAKQWIKRH